MPVRETPYGGRNIFDKVASLASVSTALKFLKGNDLLNFKSENTLKKRFRSIFCITVNEVYSFYFDSTQHLWTRLMISHVSKKEGGDQITVTFVTVYLSFSRMTK